MENKIYPRLLTISVNAWSDKNSTGNTFSNFFGNWDKNKLANLYLRDEEIDNKCCSKYFRITEKDIFKSLIYGIELGSEVTYETNSKHTNSKCNKIKKNSKFVEYVKRMRPHIILLLRELFWAIGFQKKNKLNSFLKEFDPEIIYMHCYSLFYAHKILNYCHNYTKAKVVIFFGDEVYTYKSVLPLKRIYHFILRYFIRKTLTISEIQYGGSAKLCDYYSNLFGKEFKLLIKGAQPIKIKPKPHNLPLRIVYAGNLLYGRWLTLSLLAKAIEEVSINKNLYSLEIYSNTPLSKKMETGLNTNYSSYMGPASYSDIVKHLNDADIVLHVESFRKKDVSLTKYSFSTKIIDCIQSGSCIVAIGPPELASIDFLKKSGAALTLHTYNEICIKLNSIVTDIEILDDCALRMQNYTKNSFELDSVRTNIFNDFVKMLVIKTELKLII